MATTEEDIKVEEVEEVDVLEETQDDAGANEDGAAKKRKRKKKKKKKTHLLKEVQEVESDVPIAVDQDVVEQLKEAAAKHFGKLEAEQREAQYQFWKDQPVPQFQEDAVAANDAIQAAIPVSEVQAKPYPLHKQLEWDDLDLNNSEVLDEVYTLLYENYVEDDDNMFRFDYSKEFLKWALMPPGWKKSWHIGIRAVKNKKLLAFITAIPANMRIFNKVVPLVEINFLCIHKGLREKRLSPTLIKEITRRVHLQNIWQAVYTAGRLLPRPVSVSTYYHRTLNPKKLVDVRFTGMSSRMTMARMIKLYKLPTQPQTPGYRSMVEKDAAQVTVLLNDYLSKYKLAPVLSEADVKHFLLPRKGILNSFVVETKGKVTDFVSFYALPSTIMQHPDYDTLWVAYSYYNVSTVTPWKDLMNDALISAKQLNFDVFNALNIMDNDLFLKELKFGVGDGKLHYYLYNWNCPAFKPEEMGLVLM